MERDYSKVIAKINRQIGSDANNLSKIQNLIETFKQDFTDTALKVNDHQTGMLLNCNLISIFLLKYLIVDGE